MINRVGAHQAPGVAWFENRPCRLFSALAGKMPNLYRVQSNGLFYQGWIFDLYPRQGQSAGADRLCGRVHKLTIYRRGGDKNQSRGADGSQLLIERGVRSAAR